MKAITRVTAVFAALFMLCALTACGQTGDEALGVYSLVQLRSGGEAFEPESIYEQTATLELKSRGRAVLTLEGEAYEGKWFNKDGVFDLVTDGGVSHGTLADGVCTLDILDSGLVHVFTLGGAEIAVSEPDNDGAADDGETGLQSMWNGGWYGWWAISNADGDWAVLDRQGYDCFARISIDAGGTGSLVLWDEQMSADSPMGDVKISVGSVSADEPMGIASSTGGSFWLTQIQPDEWKLDPAAYGFENMLVIDNGHYESEEGSFDYQIVLRPWGTVWDDVESTAPELLPYFYKDWYLRAIDAGEDMPDSFDASQAVPESDETENEG